MLSKVKGLILVSPLALALNAVAADMPAVRVEARADLVKTTSDNDTDAGQFADKSNDEASPTRFVLPYARIDIKGKYNDSLSYRAKFRLNKLPSSTYKDSTLSSLDYAYIDHTLMEGLKLRFGKQYMNIGGWEGTYSSKDLYSNSLAFDEASSYRVGLGLTYSFQGHSVNVQVANNSFEQTNSSTFFYGAQFVGNFMEGLVQPILSYHMDNFTEQKHTATNGVTAKPDGANKWMAAGVRTVFEALTAEVDYLDNTYEPQSSATTDKDDATKSIAFNAAYKVQNFKPQFRYAQSQSKTDDVKMYDRTDWSLAVEYFPFEKMDFNYHVAYTSQAYDYVAAATKDAELNTLVVGFTGTF